MKTTVYINGRFLGQATTGVQRFALEILVALDKGLDPGTMFECICLVPSSTIQGNLPVFNNIKVQACGILDGNLWEQLELPFFARRGLLVNLCNIGPLSHFNQIIYIYDASVFAVPQAYSLAFKLKYRLVFYILGRTAKKVLTISHFSKKELAHYLNIPEDRMTVIYAGCDHISSIEADDSIIARNGLLGARFFLTVGSSSLHKNVQIVEKAIENRRDDTIKLVIAGGNFSRVFTNVKKADSQNIKRIGYVTDGELKSLYLHAIGLIFPSLYEGFGLPPLEAMACGCPVLSSDRASLPEICGQAVQYFNPSNIAELNSRMDELVCDPALRDSLRQKGLERAQKFTWHAAAVSLLETIQSQLLD